MAVAEDGFLARVVTDRSKEYRRQVELLSVYVFLAEQDRTHLASDRLELLLKERGHAEHIIAILRVSAHTT